MSTTTTTDKRQAKRCGNTRRFSGCSSLLFLFALVALLVHGPLAATSKVADEIGQWTLEGAMPKVKQNINISGIALNETGDLLVVATDEGAHIHLFRRKGKMHFEAITKKSIELEAGETEADIEGLAWVGNHLYAIGSHSVKRKKTKADKDRDENLKRLSTVVHEPTRDRLFRLELKSDGKAKTDTVEKASLAVLFDNHPVLQRFRDIPSKENGIDIEGLAIDSDGKGLIAGLRGPILRGPYAIALKVFRTAAEPIHKKKLKSDKLAIEVIHLDLSGRGIRGISEIDGGYLVLGGPVGDEPSPYQVFLWDGNSSVPGKRPEEAAAHVKPLCIVPTLEPAEAAKTEGISQAKAEGIQTLRKGNGLVEFVIVYDSGKDGRPTVYTCPF